MLQAAADSFLRLIHPINADLCPTMLRSLSLTLFTLLHHYIITGGV